MNLILNIPMFIIGWKLLGKTRFYLYGNWNSRCFYIHQNIYDLPI